jgi:hypothetical protein
MIYVIILKYKISLGVCGGGKRSFEIDQDSHFGFIKKDYCLFFKANALF